MISDHPCFKRVSLKFVRAKVCQQLFPIYILLIITSKSEIKITEKLTILLMALVLKCITFVLNKSFRIKITKQITKKWFPFHIFAAKNTKKNRSMVIFRPKHVIETVGLLLRFEIAVDNANTVKMVESKSQLRQVELDVLLSEHYL